MNQKTGTVLTTAAQGISYAVEFDGCIASRHSSRKAAEQGLRKLQADLPGAAPDPAGLARKLASEPLRPSKAQLPCDQGLFSDEADQLDLVSLFRE